MHSPEHFRDIAEIQGILDTYELSRFLEIVADELNGRLDDEGISKKEMRLLLEAEIIMTMLSIKLKEANL